MILKSNKLAVSISMIILISLSGVQKVKASDCDSLAGQAEFYKHRYEMFSLANRGEEASQAYDNYRGYALRAAMCYATQLLSM